MERSAALLTIISAFLVQNLFATAHTDSLLAFTGAKEGRFVWLQHKWCNDAYTPNAAYGADSWALVAYDTKSNAVRTVSPAATLQSYGKISGRIDRSGKWIVWNDASGKRSRIQDFAGTSAAKDLIPNGNTMWFVNAFSFDATSRKQYIYTLDNFDAANEVSGNDKVYRIPFDEATGTVNLGQKVDVGIPTGGGYSDLGTSSVSGDGRYIAMNYPWPTDYLFDTQTKKIIDRHADDPNAVFGCQPHVAPDNSYRFFHCMSEHEGVYMFTGDMTKKDWVPLIQWSNTLPGFPPSGHTAAEGITTEFAVPAWSNHPRIISDCWAGGFAEYPEDSWWGTIDPSTQSAAWVQNEMLYQAKACVGIHRMAPEGKTAEASMYVYADKRSRDILLDSWFDNGETTSGPAVAIASVPERQSKAVGPQLLRTGSLVSVASSGTERSIVRVNDMLGRLVREEAGAGTLSIDTKDFAPGMYTVSAICGWTVATQQMSITR